MSRVLKFSESFTLALHACGYLVGKPGLIPLKEIAGAFRVSEAHLSKVMQRLNKSGLVRGSRGPLGGYSLTHEPKEIHLIDLYEAIEGPFVSHTCLFDQPVCPSQGCPLGAFLGELESRVRSQLEQTTLEDMVKGMKGDAHAS